MPSRSQQHTPPQQSQGNAASVNNDITQSSGPSNAAQAEEARTPEGTAAGLANYQSTLGQWLGTELYDAVAPHLTLEKISGVADDALMGVFSSLMGELDKLDPANNTADLEKFSAAFKKEFGTAAGGWVKENGAGLTGSLAAWVDANPELIATAALLAAAGAYLADAKIPELSTSLGLTEDLKLKLGAKLGSLRDISIDQVSAQLSSTTAPLVAAIKVSPGDGATKTEFSGSYGEETQKLTVNGELNGEDLALLNVQGLVKSGNQTTTGGYTRRGENETINVDVNTVDGGTTRITGVDYDPNSGVLTLRNVIKEVDGKSQSQFSSSISSDGSHSEGVSLNQPLAQGLMGSLSLSNAAQRLGADSSYQLTNTQKASLGLNYDTKDLDAALKLSSGSDGQHSALTSVDYKFGDGFETGADGKTQWGNKETLEVGAYFGFRDPDEFQTYMAKYRFQDVDGGKHSVNLMMEEKLGPVYARVQQQWSSSLSGSDWTTTAQGAYFLNDNVALIGGAQYKGNSMGEDSFAPQLGAQINGIPLVVTYEPESKTTTIGVTFKFGR